MNSKLIGSHLTRAMLTRGNAQVWCAVSDDSDDEAMQDLQGNDFTAYIVSYSEDSFFSDTGMQWAFAVPIKVVALEE